MTSSSVTAGSGTQQRPGARPAREAPRARAAAQAADLQIAGLVPLSTVDWPGRLAATVFCQGCPWRCTYCHNTAILDTTVPGAVPFSDLEALLAKRAGLLDAVVFSGGEATSQHALVPAARAVREAGYAVGLHTGGAYPTRLRELLGVDLDGVRHAPSLVDWVGFDVKAVPAGYEALVGRGRAWVKASQSLRMLLAAGIDHELRMTLTPALLDQVPAVIELLAELGGRALVLQRARPDGAETAFAEQLRALPGWEARFTETAAEAAQHGERLGVRVTSRG